MSDTKIPFNGTEVVSAPQDLQKADNDPMAATPFDTLGQYDGTALKTWQDEYEASIRKFNQGTLSNDNVPASKEGNADDTSKWRGNTKGSGF